MAVDPQVQDFLDELKELKPPPLSSQSIEQARRGVIVDSAALGSPEPVAKVEDCRVPGPAGEIPVRIYTPHVPHVTGPLPVLVYYHGGGWVLGEIATHDAFCCSVSNAAECIVVSVGYRLAPEHKYPAAVDDAYAATKWVFEHIGRFDGDSQRIAVGGDSAGGNLAAVVALMAQDRAAFQPVMQVLIYPITDFNFERPSYQENADGYLLTREDMIWFWRCYLAKEEDGYQPYASPLRAPDLAGLPSALVITAEYDPLRDEGEAYAARLREASVPVVLSRYHGMIHAFIRRTSRFDQARAALSEIGGELKKAFAGLYPV